MSERKSGGNPRKRMREFTRATSVKSKGTVGWHDKLTKVSADFLGENCHDLPGRFQSTKNKKSGLPVHRRSQATAILSKGNMKGGGVAWAVIARNTRGCVHASRY